MYTHTYARIHTRSTESSSGYYVHTQTTSRTYTCIHTHTHTLQKNGPGEVLKGMWGEEEYRPLTVLPPPKKDAPLLMSDIDGIPPRAQTFSRDCLSLQKYGSSV